VSTNSHSPDNANPSCSDGKFPICDPTGKGKPCCVGMRCIEMKKGVYRCGNKFEKSVLHHARKVIGKFYNNKAVVYDGNSHPVSNTTKYTLIVLGALVLVYVLFWN